MGAVTAVLYSAKFPRNVKKIVLDSPFCSLAINAEQWAI
jgi:pimeloyl-ACP methyl ester carboxylesterase